MQYLDQLREKILSYKTYNDQTKSRVLKQLDNRAELTELEYKTVLKRLPTVMKATKVFCRNYNNIKKQVVRLEIHKYAPELNTLHFKDGTIIKTPQKTTIEDATEYLTHKGINFK